MSPSRYGRHEVQTYFQSISRAPLISASHNVLFLRNAPERSIVRVRKTHKFHHLYRCQNYSLLFPRNGLCYDKFLYRSVTTGKFKVTVSSIAWHQKHLDLLRKSSDYIKPFAERNLTSIVIRRRFPIMHFRIKC
jgi:hypothetical protein